VDVPPMLEAAAIAAGLAAVFPIVLALGARGALARRRGGNAVLVGAVRPPPLPPLRARAAADLVPGALLDPGAMTAFAAAAAPFRDAGAL
jgi:hypothetical protein